MTDINNRINDLVSNFVTEITRLARAAAVDTLSRALSDGGGAVRTSAGTGTGTATYTGARRGRKPKAAGAAIAAPSSSSSSSSSSARRSKGAKRPKSEIAEIQERVHSHIRSNPGQRIEQINKVLGTRTADLTLPLKKLIADGSITTKGARRATTYLPGDGGGGKKRRGRAK